MILLALYMTHACHLCDMAEKELSKAREKSKFILHLVDIVDDPDLMEKYGETIPVLQHNLSNRQLCWPFSSVDVIKWLKTDIEVI